MSPQVVIARAGHEQAGEVLTVQRAAYLSEAQRYRDPFLPPLVQSLAELIGEIAAGRRLVALLGARVVGTVRAVEDDAVLHVGRLAIAPDQQGRGIGTRLLAAAEALAGPAVTTFALFTGADSGDNVRLYERVGYRTVGHDSLPEGPGLIHLHKPRTPAVEI